MEPDYFAAAGEPMVKAYFYDREVPLVKKSKEAGELITEKRTFIKIRVTGQTDIVDRPAQERDFERFPKSHAAYLGELVESEDGIAIEKLPGISEGLALSWRSKGVRTVQDLAKMPNELIGVLGFSGKDYREKARELVGYIPAEDLGPHLKKKTDDLESENAALRAEMEALKKAVNAAPKKPPSRKKRVNDAA